jgi:hypothetical protein
VSAGLLLPGQIGRVLWLVGPVSDDVAVDRGSALSPTAVSAACRGCRFEALLRTDAEGWGQ